MYEYLENRKTSMKLATKLEIRKQLKYLKICSHAIF